MSQESTTVVLERHDISDEDAELAGFESVSAKTALPTELLEKVEQPADETVSEEASSVEETPAAPVTTEPAAGITKQQLDELYASASTVKELKDGLAKLRDDAFGRLGGLERNLKQSSESGLEWDITEADLADVEREVPFLAPALQKTLANIAKKAKVKVPVGQSVDVEAVKAELKAEFNQQLEQRSFDIWKKTQSDMLDYNHRGWVKIVQDKTFHTWLDEHDASNPGVKEMFLKSNSAIEIGGVLDKFKTHQAAIQEKAKPKPKPPVVNQTRTDRLREALPTRGSSSNPPPPKGELTEEEAFDSVAKKRK